MNTQPEALRLADALEASQPNVYAGIVPTCAALLRTQHADLERKDALMKLYQRTLEENEQLKAQQAQAEAVPPGYVLVPVEPTDEMLKAAAKACDGRMYPADMRHGPRAQNADRYRAMIAAAPLPVEDHLKLHAVEELCQLGYTVKDGELFPPDHLHKLMEAAGHPLSVRKGGTA